MIVGTPVSGRAIGTYTDSFLTRAIVDFRRYTDEPTVNAKYTDSVLADMLGQSYAHIIAEINRNRHEPVVAKYTVTYINGTSKYLLPPVMSNIFAIYTEDTGSGTKVFYHARSRYAIAGRSVWVEGATLHVQPNYIGAGKVITIEYIPAGTPRLHNGACTVDSTGLIVTMGENPNAGTIDTRLNAYGGSVFRLVTSSESEYDYVQERNILSYDGVNLTLTLDVALNPNPESTGTTVYEIAPAIHVGLDHIMALYLAKWISGVEGDTKRFRMVDALYHDVLRNLRLTAYYSNLSEANILPADTDRRVRNRVYG